MCVSELIVGLSAGRFVAWLLLNPLHLKHTCQAPLSSNTADRKSVQISAVVLTCRIYSFVESGGTFWLWGKTGLNESRGELSTVLWQRRSAQGKHQVYYRLKLDFKSHPMRNLSTVCPDLSVYYRQLDMLLHNKIYRNLQESCLLVKTQADSSSRDHTGWVKVS